MRIAVVEALGFIGGSLALTVLSEALKDRAPVIRIRAVEALKDAGTVHAIGAGVTLVEVQQSSDTTFRIFDWGRGAANGEPRETHLEEAFQAIDYEREAEGPIVPSFDDETGVNRHCRLLEVDAFTVELLQVHEPLAHIQNRRNEQPGGGTRPGTQSRSAAPNSGARLQRRGFRT